MWKEEKRPAAVKRAAFVTNWLWGFFDWCTKRRNLLVTCPWDMTSPSRVALSNRIFPGQCKWWQIPSSRIMRFPANLPNSGEWRGLGGFGRGAWCLTEWCHSLHPPAAAVSPSEDPVDGSAAHPYEWFWSGLWGSGMADSSRLPAACQAASHHTSAASTAQTWINAMQWIQHTCSFSVCSKDGSVTSGNTPNWSSDIKPLLINTS